VFGDRLHVTVLEAAAALPLIEKELKKHRLPVKALRQIQPTMENAFIRLIKEHQTEKQSADLTKLKGD
jgi:hypothetical protein